MPGRYLVSWKSCDFVLLTRKEGLMRETTAYSYYSVKKELVL